MRRMSHRDFCISVARGFIFCRFQSVSLRDRDYDVNSCKSVPVAEQVSDARSRSSIHLVATSERKNQQGGNRERERQRGLLEEVVRRGKEDDVAEESFAILLYLAYRASLESHSFLAGSSSSSSTER